MGGIIVDEQQYVTMRILKLMGESELSYLEAKEMIEQEMLLQSNMDDVLWDMHNK